MKRMLHALAAIVVAHHPCRAQSCQTTVEPFDPGALQYPYFNGAVFDAVLFDDGSGVAMYVAGAFTAPAMPSGRLVRFRSDEGWTAVTGGPNFTVQALAVWNDGRGDALYVGGNFSNAGGLPVNFIARWDGTSFEPLGSGFDNQVTALEVFDGALFAAGEFTMAGGQPASSIARWNGQQWSPVGVGIDPGFPLDLFAVRDLHAHDDGTGPALYVGGGFWSAGGIVTPGLARWTSSRGWESIGACDGDLESVWSLATFDPGTGSNLIAAGRFRNIGGLPAAEGFARWNGAQWSLIADRLGGTPVLYATPISTPTGNALLFCGEFSSVNGDARIAKEALWRGTTFQAWPGSVRTPQIALQIDDPQGQRTFLGGVQSPFGGFVQADTWMPVDVSFESSPRDLLWLEDPAFGTPALYLIGWKLRDSRGYRTGVVRRTDGEWIDIGFPVNAATDALLDHRGATPKLVVSGGGRVFQFDGSMWSDLTGESPDTDLRDLTIVPSGPAEGLYAFGPTGAIWRWHDGIWTNVRPSGAKSLAVVDFPGVGPRLFASFDTVDNSIFQFDGSQWTLLGQGLNAGVLTLAAGDLGGGTRLFAGGTFSASRGFPTGGLAAWDGVRWAPVLPDLSFRVRDMRFVEGPCGPVLVIQKFATRDVYTWDGTDLEFIGLMPSNAGRFGDHPIQDGSDLCVFAIDSPASFRDELIACVRFARLPCPADITGASDPNDPAYGVPDGVVDAADFFYYLDQFAVGNYAIADLTGSSDPSDPGYGTPDGVLDAADFFYFLDEFVFGCP